MLWMTDNQANGEDGAKWFLKNMPDVWTSGSRLTLPKRSRPRSKVWATGQVGALSVLKASTHAARSAGVACIPCSCAPNGPLTIGHRDMDWLFKFPQLDPEFLLAVKRAIDGALKALTRGYGQSIEDFFYPLLRVLIFFETTISNAPWPLVVLALAAIAWFAARRWAVVAAVVGTLIAIGLLGLWQDAMKTISLVFTATIFAIAIGMPLGILMNRYKRVGAVMHRCSTSCRRCRASSISFPSSCCSASAGCQASSRWSSMPSRR